MSEELIPEPLPLEERMSQELVKHNVTEAVISSLRERYLPLKIEGLEDKETYLLVKEGRKECKSIRVLAKKVCTDAREDAVAIQKAWVAKEKEVTGRIAEVEDYLEQQEKAYEAEVAAEKEARKRKQEEQFIMRQQALSGMGALYSDGNFTLGEVSFEFSAIKESEDDVWNEAILPKFKEEYNKIEAERIEQDRLKAEKEAELKRQQEELERKQKELADKEAKLKEEADRQAAEAKKTEEQKFSRRCSQLSSLGLKPSIEDGHAYYIGYDWAVSHLDISGYNDEEWDGLITRAGVDIGDKIKAAIEEDRKEQERIELQNNRHADLYRLRGYAVEPVWDQLWKLTDDEFLEIFKAHKAGFEKAEEEKANKIAEEAAKAERERIEEEQRQAEVKRRQELRGRRKDALLQYNYVFTALEGDLADLTDTQWVNLVTEAKANHDEKIRKQEEERKAEELAKAGDKEKWNEIMERVEAIEVYAMRSSQYRKKAAILREKLEEIKAL